LTSFIVLGLLQDIAINTNNGRVSKSFFIGVCIILKEGKLRHKKNMQNDSLHVV
jgi:sporulation protein YlmC with PRC-barrel domain